MPISAKQTLEISKTVIANLFGVSRSAVSQSCSRRSIENDVLMRAYKYIIDRAPNESVRQHVAQSISVELLQILRQITEIRERKRTSAGRPPKKVNFRAFKSIIRAVVAEFTVTKAVDNAKVAEEEFNPETWQPFGATVKKRELPELPPDPREGMIIPNTHWLNPRLI